MDSDALHASPERLAALHDGETSGRTGLLGQSEAHRLLLRQLAKISKVDAEVLICGPTGVGKGLYARFIHECSDRRAAQFVALNCGALPEGLFENEMFGHMAGAFTGAGSSAEGLVAAAEGGTLFLDEVDALSLPAQVKLLRLIQEKEYRRLGETRVRRVNVRFIAATNGNLPQKVKDGKFREDLFFRLRVVPINVLPLCERPDDIVALLLAYIERYAGQYGLPPIMLSEAAWERLVTYHWPGNVRELENCIRFLTCQQLGRPVEPQDLPLLHELHPDLNSPHGRLFCQGLRQAKQEVVSGFEKQYLEFVLRRANGNIAEAARLARKHRRAFFALLRKHGISASAYRSTPAADDPPRPAHG